MAIFKWKKSAVGINALLTIASALVILGIFVGIGQVVLDKTMQNVDTVEAANLSINETINALGEFSDWYDLIVIVTAAAIILSLILAALVFGAGRRGGM